MNLRRPWAVRKRGQAGWRRPRISYAADEHTGCCSRRHRCFRKHQPYTSRRETGRRRLSRKRPQCCGRGEAARNCVSAAGAFSTAPTERVPHVLGTRAAGTLELQLRPGPTGSIGQDHKTKTELKGGRVQWGERRVCGRRRHRILQLCRMRARRTRKEIGTISAETDPGATARGSRGFFPSGFPIHVVDFGPPHPFTVIPTAGGTALAAAARPRIGAARGAAKSRSLWGSGRGYRYKQEPPAMG
jgi:hypothetical protein